MPYPGPGGYFASKDEVAAYLERYAARFNLPVRLHTHVDALTRGPEGYVLAAGAERFSSDHVVVATGPFQCPRIPAVAAALDPAMVQLHSEVYRNPAQLPTGSVLVVGVGNSGAEIAVELAAAGRRVWPSGRDTGHVAPFLKSRLARWMVVTLLNSDTPPGRKFKARIRSQGAPLMTLTAQDIARAGVEQVARLDGVRDGHPRLADGRVLEPSAVVWAMGFQPDFG